MTELRAVLEAGLPGSDGPGVYPGAVALVLADGEPVGREAVGEAVRYADRDHSLLPDERRIPARPDTIWDIASITKLFTAVLTLGLVEEGLIDLDEPLGRWFPQYRGGVKQRSTLRMLMTHVGGYLPGRPVWRESPFVGQRRRLLLEAEPVREPGSTYQYSDIGYQTAGFLAELVTGQRLEALVEERILIPLGLTGTGYNPAVTLLPRIAAAEQRDDLETGVIHGRVHDENANGLGGVAGHAGLFSTAADLARFGELLRGDGTVDGVTLLKPESVAVLRTDQIPADVPHPYGQGVGARIDDPKIVGPLSGAFGHTGFTGTSLLVDQARGLTVVLMTNRVHPTRNTDINPTRAGVSAVAFALAARR
ncbi:MAG: serine hydrolase domain-containing protein [Actinocatenispora sp.]